MDKAAETKWDKAAISLENYKEYYKKKTNKFDLTLIDLLYISNFKGGNATINEKEDEKFDVKLQKYGEVLIEIDNIYKDRNLAEINDTELEKLNEYINKIIKLSQEKETAIDGFKSSYISALLHSYFPNLIPVLDRRILFNLGIVDIEDKKNAPNEQIKEIEQHYKELIRKIRNISKDENKSIRDIDRDYFIMDIHDQQSV